MNKHFMLKVLVSVVLFQGPIYGILGTIKDTVEDVGGAVGDGLGSVGDYAQGFIKDGQKFIGEAGKAGYYVGQVAADGLKYVTDAGDWALTYAGKLIEAVACLGEAGINVASDLVSKLAGKMISFEEISAEGALGAATVAVRVKGRIAIKPFNLSVSVGRNGFTQDGFKKLLYNPLAKASPSTAEADRAKRFRERIRRGVGGVAGWGRPRRR